MSKPFLQVDGLSKVYPDGQGGELTVFEDIRFALEKGEFVCIIGHSGCGKSTILNVLAGLDESSSGNVVMNGKEVKGPGLERGVVFQNYSLLPWKTALNRKPSQLSGGMRQRVSIARAFATQPELLLLDEPFGALDALTRGVIQDELVKIWEETRQTVFMITHDVDEAILLSDRIFLMSNGQNARIAESVNVDIPHPRARSTIFQNPAYHKTRDYLVDFLVNRSGTALPNEDGSPKAIEPAQLQAGKTEDKDESTTRSAAKAVNA
ncbi:MAG: nitrate/sulfonate/bicarbonate ABC transporter ATP-binding protein [Marinobacter sp. 34-60-7]|nr:MAG: nitrate/sulfonate/bicarbonate ABC transporter ATP-binding protein [Marinobacter sp. 34-60-7]